ncbi:MAG: 50S ribosomal protein L11 methyltransferase [Pseudomonadota bacterium]
MTQTRLYFFARKPEANHIASILDPTLDDEIVSTALFEDEKQPGVWCYSLYVETQEVDGWKQRILSTLGSDGFGLTLNEEVLPDLDWVTQSLEQLAPVEAGQYFVHGSHDRALAKNKRFAIEIDAGQAFGTGHHGTTAGCLDMLERVLKKHAPQVAYDIGCGSGVLAIAMAKSCQAAILATDIDPISTRVARENAALNGVGNAIRFETANGFSNTAFTEYGPADLVMANILAGPLTGLAPHLAAHTMPSGVVILSGLLPHQEARIVANYRLQGLIYERRHIRDGWLTLLLRKH